MSVTFFFVTFIIFFFSGNKYLFPLIPPKRLSIHIYVKIRGKNRGKKGEFLGLWGEFFCRWYFLFKAL